MTDAKCNHCSQLSEFTVPEPLCEYHWFSTFWLIGYSKEQLKQVIEESDFDMERQVAQELLDGNEEPT